jgi:hypothetical protein
MKQVPNNFNWSFTNFHTATKDITEYAYKNVEL